MIDIIAGLATKYRQLKRRFDELDASKAKPEEIKATADALAAVESLLAKEKEKKQKRQEAKEKTAKEKPAEELEKEAAPKCALCGNAEFPTWKEYQKHRQEKHPGVKHEYTPMDPTQKKDIVERVEKSPSLAPYIIGEEKVEDNKVVIPKDEFVEEHEHLVEILDPIEKEKTVQEKELERVKKAFDIDACVEPIRGAAGSHGKVMRHDDPDSLVYVMWEKGPLKERESFGGYYAADLKLKAEEKEEELCTCGPEVVCPKCKEQKFEEYRKHYIKSDLKQNYYSLLKNLKEEYSEELVHGKDTVWISRLEQKIKELEQKIQEKFAQE